MINKYEVKQLELVYIGENCDRLTYGDSYIIRKFSKGYDTFVRYKSEWFSSDKFISIDEWRDFKINKLLNVS